MAGIITISPINSLSFVRVNSLLPNFDNTLYQDQNKIVSKKPYCQKIVNGDVLTIQVKTDFTAVTATLHNMLTGAVTTLTPVAETVYTDFSFWEIPATFSTNGFFKMIIIGTLTGYEIVTYVSEMIEVRSEWDNVKIEAYNNENTAYVDYSNGIKHLFRVYGVMKFSDVGGKEEFYNNQGNEELIYSENETIDELTIEDIPYYLISQLIYCRGLDNFIVNNKRYIVKDHSLNPHQGSHNFDMTLKLTRYDVIGINTDFQASEV